MENWKDIRGFEGRYQVSDLGRVKSLPFMQRYLLRNGKEAFRRTSERILRSQVSNSGYVLLQLWLDNTSTPFTVHSLVARAFLPGPVSETVNHINGCKTDNRAVNLEWATYTENHRHAVATGLNKQAMRVIDPLSGTAYPSISEAARLCGVSPKTARHWERA